MCAKKNKYLKKKTRKHFRKAYISRTVILFFFFAKEFLVFSSVNVGPNSESYCLLSIIRLDKMTADFTKPTQMKFPNIKHKQNLNS